MSPTLHVAVPLGRSHLRRHWRALLLLGVVAGLVGGVATAAFAGARRTATAYDRLLAATDHADAYLQVLEAGPEVVEDVRTAPSVERVVDSRFVVGRNTAAPNVVLLPVQVAVTPLPDPLVRRGRPVDPSAVDEVVLSERMAEHLGLDVGDVWPYQALTQDEFADLLRDRWEGTSSGFRIDLRVVGIARAPTDASVAEFPHMHGTPALYEALDDGPEATRGIWVHFAAGAGLEDLADDVPALADVVTGDAGLAIDFDEERRPLDRSITVLVVGLVAFGAVTVGAGIVVVGQLVARAVQRTDADRRVLRDLGLPRAHAVRAASAGGAVSVVVAAVTTVVVAATGSRWTPVGVAQSVEPDPGVDVNVPVVLAGAACTALVLWLLALAAARQAVRPQRPGGRRSLVPRVAGLGSGPVPSVGAVLAVGSPGPGGGAGRTAFSGVVAAVCGVVAVLVFSSSLDRMVTDTERWGWTAHHGVEMPEPVRDRTYAALDRSAEVEAYAELRGATVTVAGQAVDAYWLDPRKGAVAPTVLAGRLPDRPDEVAAGPALLEDLGAGVGDELVVDGRTLRVVGSTLPFAREERSSATSGVLLGAPIEGEGVFTMALVRFADGVDPAAAAADLYGDLEYDAPDPPVDVVNLGELRPLPVALAWFLALVGSIALAQVALGIAARARGDLAVLRALGMARRTAASAVLVATGLVGVVAVAVGGTLGLVAGRLSWRAVAASTGLATDAAVPATVWGLIAAVAACVALAGLVAGRGAVRRPPGPTLRAE